MSRPAVFFDRDGTLSHEVGYVNHLTRFQPFSFAVDAIRAVNAANRLAVVVTNQAGVARGYYSEEHVRRVNDRLEALLKAEGVDLDRIYYCPHHPTEGMGAHTLSCDCRKPEPGMLIQAASDQPINLGRSFVVGDKLTDIEMAHRVGAKGVLVLTGYGNEQIAKKGEAGPHPDRIASDLEEAAEWIVTQIQNEGHDD